MNLTQLIRKLESQLKSTEKLSRKYDAEANHLRRKLTGVASIVGKSIASAFSGGKKKLDGIRKSGMSAAGRARIRAAQKIRWAAFHAKHGRKVKKAKTSKRQGNLSRAGRANIIAAQKARWAAYKKNKGK